MHLQFDLQQLWFSSNFWWYDKRFLWYNNMLAFSGHVIFVNLINHKHEYSINKGHIKVENSLVFLPPHQQNFFHLRFIHWSILKYKAKIMTEKIEISAFLVDTNPTNVGYVNLYSYILRIWHMICQVQSGPMNE